VKRLLGVLVLVGTFVFIIGYVAGHGPSTKHCTVLAAGVAHADTNEDCLHQDAISARWAETQLRQLAIAGATVTTGLLYTDANGENPATLTSGESGAEFGLASRYLRANAGSIIRDVPPGQQAAGHVEPKAAALMRHDTHVYGVLVINNSDGPCTWASGPGCVGLIELILPKGSTMVVWWPGGHHEIFSGKVDP
jgi:hypothetical protein